MQPPKRASLAIPYPVIHDVLRNACHWTNDILSRSYKLGHRVREETLTDINLLEIEYASDNVIRTKVYTRHEEGNISGVDWLWIIKSGKQLATLPMVVQAKLISPSGKCYTIHKHAASTKKFQIDLLDEYAAKCGFYSFYCFYNIPKTAAIARSSLVCNLGKSDIESMGCAIMPLSSVRTLLKKGPRPALNDILPKAHSLACMSVHCLPNYPGPVFSPADPTPGMAHAIHCLTGEKDTSNQMTTFGRQEIAQFLEENSDWPIRWNNVPSSIGAVVVMSLEDKPKR